MRSLPLLISLALFSSPLWAHESLRTAEGLHEIKNEVVKLREEIHTLKDQNQESDEMRQLKKEVVRLRKDIRSMQDLILDLQALVETQSKSTQPEVIFQPVNERPKWACYIKDIRAGGMHSKGFSEVEAKGKLLETCTEKGGFCMEDRITCSAE
ncbi:THO complex subunit 7 family protein [Microbulbifer variabilis]|uniref:THO complex subunit 7 family protein n=1 Tax=Microbulbifer variabilis TaxID=266805 RepID=UPI001CFC6DEF|nr:THO complex subunit 7 family protein [Microbulbifer variabilis]